MTASLFDRQDAYNPASQINQITELAQTKSFGYDNLDRLTGAAYTNPNQTNETYVFDAVGNRTGSSRSATYAYQANNRLVSTSAGNYGYSANGNMISKTDGLNSWTYVWDYENRMTSATSGAATVGYKYDALGRRIKRIDPTGSVTKFTYDGMDVVMDDDTITGITKYQNGLGIDDKLKLTNGADTKYFLQDHLGSTVGLADSSGNQTSSASYDSFGNSTNNLTTRYQYTGREKDEFTGLMYYRARWYDGNLGRFISEDPIGFSSGDVNLLRKHHSKNLGVSNITFVFRVFLKSLLKSRCCAASSAVVSLNPYPPG